MKPDTTVEITRISMVVTKTLPPVKSAASSPNILMTPVLNKPPTMMNRPTMNSRVSHSTLDVYSDCSSREVRMRTPAPSNATSDGARWMAGETTNPVNTSTMTTPHLMSSRRSRMASPSRSDVTAATLSALTAERPRNSNGVTASRTSITMATTGDMFARKALKDRDLRAPMMMFGGSPTSVAAPPTLEANTSAISSGTGFTSSASQTSRVTGAISNTETTLGRMAEANAITTISSILMRKGEPLARLTAQIATYSNTPVWRRMLTIIIIPSIKKMTSQSIPLSSEKKTSGESITGRHTNSPAPPRATGVLLNRSLMMKA